MLKRVYEINRETITIRSLSMAVLLGQLAYKVKHDIEDDELVVKVANRLREGLGIENKFGMYNLKINNNANTIELDIIEFPIKPDGKVIHPNLDMEVDKLYIEVEED